MKPELKEAIIRLSRVSNDARKHGTIELYGAKNVFADDVALACIEANTMADVRVALYGSAADAPGGNGIAPDPSATILERARNYQELKADADKMRVLLDRIEREDNHMKRLADAQLVRIAGMEWWHKDIDENLADAVERTVRRLMAEVASWPGLYKGVEKERNALRTQLAEKEAELAAYAKRASDHWAERDALRQRAESRIAALVAAGDEQAAQYVEERRARLRADGYLAADAHRESFQVRAAWDATKSAAPIGRDTEIVDWIASYWNSQEIGAQPLLGGLVLPNPTGSFRDAILSAMDKIETRIHTHYPSFDLIAHLHRQREFSLRTFGPGERTAGILAHIRKELVEIEAKPYDLTEWIDVVLLALDGALRHGGTPEVIATTLEAKQSKNMARTWPDWRTVPQGEAICHVAANEATDQRTPDVFGTFLRVLNEAYKADHVAILALIENRVPCKSALANHPTIQSGDRDPGGDEVGMLGVINGICEAVTGKRVAVCIDAKTGNITRFMEYRPAVVIALPA